MISFQGYRTIEMLARTHWSVVLRAAREADGLPVTLKALRADRGRVADIARLKHEYAAIARVSSPRVATVHGVEERSDWLLIALEDLCADDLGAVLERKKKLDVAEVLEIAIAMADAVDALHRHDLIHGEIRPKSVLVGGRGEGCWLKLWNFGVDAVVTREHEALHRAVVLREVLPYTSPEQTGRMNRAVDHRTDLYSLGVVFYEMLSGRRPFDASDPMELIHAHLAALPVAPSVVDPSVPATLGDIALKLLAKNAEDRYQSAAGLKADLEECQRRLRQGDSIEGLRLGERDESRTFQIHQKLYGREDDIRGLVGSFDSVLRGEREIVLVSGYSGIGKSTLVQEILKPLAREKGYYITGKYDQYNRARPHSGFIQAFDMLLRQILSESEERLAGWREALLAALGNNGQVICDIVPALKLVIGEQPPLPALPAADSQNRFNLTFQRLVSVFARYAHPLAIFLDDLQWIDPASLSLLQAILADGSIEALLFCGAYRDNEVSAAHPFIIACEELQRRSALKVRPIVLSPLSLDDLTAMLGDTLRRGDTRPLAEVVLRKTGGNPFFVKQFIKSLHESGALTLEGKSFAWDLSAALALQHTHNVVDLMLGTLRRMPADTQETLELASVIGNQFDLEAICAVCACSADVAYGRLVPALQEGLLTRVGDGYRFAHDRIQEAAYSVVPAAERMVTHHRIGKILLEKLGPEEGQGLFDVVSHLNSAGDLVREPAERLALARLNLRAAERIQGSGAFPVALRYLEEGAARLPGDAWSSQHDLALAFEMQKGVMQSLNGHYDAALETLAVALEHAEGRLQQTRVRRLRMNVHTLKDDLLAAIEEGTAGLRLFGLDLPAFPDDRVFADELQATMAALGGRSIDSFAELPPLTDPEIEAFLQLLEDMFTPAYLMDSNHFGISVMKILQISLQHGSSKSTIHALLNFGTLLCTGLDIAKGYEFGRAAVRLNEAHPHEENEALLCNIWCANIRHWMEPYAAAKETYLKGIHAGFERGQVLYAIYSVKNNILSGLLGGVNLAELLAELTSYMPLCKLDVADAAVWMSRAIGQICHNLMRPTEAGPELKGEWVDLEPIVANARAAHNQAQVLVADFYSVFVSVFLDACEAAAPTAYEDDPTIRSVASWQGHPGYQFYGGVALTRACDTADEETRQRYLAKVRGSLDLLAGWVALFPGNLRHRHLLLSAELARASGDLRAATDLYDEGIAAARAGGFLQDEALGNELCARHLLSAGKATAARAYITEAHALYGRWGAAAVTRRIERDFPTFLYHIERPSALSAGPLSARAPGFDIDFRAVLKASQAISGEIVLERLLERLLWIILESAGARRGFLILKDGNRLVLEVEGDTTQGRVASLQSIPLESRGDLSLSVVHYVSRTGESMVIGDALSDERLASDLYVKRFGPKSILAVPILNQGQTRGVMYLENDVTAHAFTEERVELLRLLGAQVAISIDNALMYGRLEERVAARTAELRVANERIMALNAAQRETIRLLSTPIIQVWSGVLVIPVVGSLDDARASEIMQRLLERIAHTGARCALIDLTGVDAMDSTTADHLVRLVRALELMGARGIITGMHAAVARTLTSLGLDLRGVTTRLNVQDGLRMCLREAPR